MFFVPQLFPGFFFVARRAQGTCFYTHGGVGSVVPAKPVLRPKRTLGLSTHQTSESFCHPHIVASECLSKSSSAPAMRLASRASSLHQSSQCVFSLPTSFSALFGLQCKLYKHLLCAFLSLTVFAHSHSSFCTITPFAHKN